MKSILVINTVGLNYEGITAVILNYTSYMNREGLSFDFLSQKNIDEKLYRKFSELGTLVYISKRKGTFKRYCKELRAILSKKKYDVVHIHGNSGTMAVETILCKIAGVRKIIVHCHNTHTDHPLVNALLKYPMMMTADEHLACSETAGRWLYGRHRFVVLNNAIDVDRFRFQQAARYTVRQDLSINQDTFVIGHLGHFSSQKNQGFLVSVLEEVKKTVPSVILLFLSDGPLMQQVRESVISRGLSDHVIFVGYRSNPERYYQAMDLFAFPSKWEGMALALMEAQASGLPCIASDHVSREANVTGTVYYLDLDAGQWAEAVRNAVLYMQDREDTSANNIEKIADNGFDISTEAAKLERIYRKNRRGKS